MRIAEIEFIKALSNAQVTSLISILEKGLEVSKVEYIATQDDELRSAISDGCILLSFLYFRSLGKAA